MTDYCLIDINFCFFKGFQETLLVPFCKNKRENCTWQLANLECMHNNPLIFIIYSISTSKYFNIIFAICHQGLDKIKTISPTPIFRRWKERRHIEINWLLHTAFLNWVIECRQHISNINKHLFTTIEYFVKKYYYRPEIL